MPAEPSVDRQALDARLQAAARADDAPALVEGYRLAADLAVRARHPDEAGFFLTHAYVWALVAGDDSSAEALASALRRAGRLD
jgi:hypothetical protein